MDELLSLAHEQFCYLTTTGRVTGNPHSIEIWFAIAPEGRTLYMLSGGGDQADWVKNIGRNPQVQFRIRDRVFDGSGRVVSDGDEERLARRLIVAKYYGRDRVHSTGWEAESLPVAVDISI